MKKERESFSQLLNAEPRLIAKEFRDKVEDMIQPETALSLAMKKAKSERNMRNVRNLFRGRK
jgi:hypothetical protein